MPRLPVFAFVAVTCIAVCDGVTVQEKTKLHAAMRVRQLLPQGSLNYSPIRLTCAETRFPVA